MTAGWGGAAWRVTGLAVALVLQGCAGPPRAAPVATQLPSPTPATLAAQPAAPPPTQPATALAVMPVPTPQVPAPLPLAELGGVVARARELLLEGQVEAARGELFRVLATDAAHAPAQLLLRSLDEDPRRLLGTGQQRVALREGETLLTLATERLREPNLVWALARLNGVAVPLALRPGQVLLVPQPTAAALLPNPLTPTQPAQPAIPAASAAPTAPTAPAAPVAAVPPAAAPATELRRQAQACERRQDLCCAQRHLADAARLDPADTAVQADQQRVRELLRAFTQRVGPLACAPV